MAKIIKFPLSATPKKRSLQRVKRSRANQLEALGQLNLFDETKVFQLYKKSTFEKALEFEDLGRHDLAKQTYEQMLRNHEEISDAHCNLGILEFESGNFLQAIHHFSLALKADPRHAEAHYNLGNAYGEVGNTTLSLIHFQCAIDIDPDMENTYFNASLMYIKQQDWKMATQMLTMYIDRVEGEEKNQALELLRKIPLE